MGRNRTTTAWVLMLFAAMIGYGAALVMFSSVLAPVWLPLGTAAVLAGALMIWSVGMWRRFTGIRSAVANIIIGMIVSTGVLFAGVTGVNFIKIRGGEPVTAEATIVKAYRTKHYHSRRVRRNVYVKGSAYWQYHVRVQLADGREKTMGVPLSTYNKLSRRRSVEVEIRHGFLGMDIISMKR
ncbi:MAG: hypothetical protein HFJ94_02515 [Muribaculaceae bacterium]|nr:hypothetical protein [Muribaculaceae bacterium]